MKKIIVAALCVIIIIITFQCTERNLPEDDLKISLAHGVLVGPEGLIRPDANYISDIQKHFISKYSDSLSRKEQSEAAKIQRTINAKVTDKVLANALYLDWIADQLNFKRTSTLAVTNNALRLYYIHNIQTDPVITMHGETWTKGIESNIAKDLAEVGLKVFDESVSGSPTYINSCVSEGVPIPAQMFDDQWESLGILEDQILFNGSDSELLIYLSDDPPGFCLSMIRHEAGNFGNHFDLICFGTESNNACFFESSQNGITVGEDLHITDLYAGENVFGGTCINCHVGENPFIVHPGDQAFIAASQRKGNFFGTPPNLNGTDMFTAINVPSWPDNAPPFDNLSAVQTEDKKCTSCHTSSYAGRFPDLSQVVSSTAFKEYCDVILSATLGEQSGFHATMPFEDVDNMSNYAFQIEQLKSMCGANPDNGKIINNPFTDDLEVLSPPRVIDPLTPCAKVIYVEGFKQKSEVTLFINDQEVGKINNAEGADPLEFSNISGLKIGDKVQTMQIKDGNKSLKSIPTTVIDYKDIYPNGFPMPIVEPTTIYECSNVIAVRYDVPGLEMLVKVNGSSPVITHTFNGYKVVKPGKTPFVIGDEFTAQINSCGEESPISAAVKAQAAPSIMEDAVINPESLFPGQTIINIENLTYGSESMIINQNSEVVGTFSSPLSWRSHQLNNPISLTDEAFVTQKLCELTSTPTRTVQVSPCEDVPAAQIRDPQAGDDFVITLETIAGASIHVYDSNGNEIGDSNLSFIYLTRNLVAGETITVFMQIGECISPVAMQYVV